MKLLPKQKINAEVATQRKNQIDQGLALAKKVDALRETFQEEESRVEIFRSETMKKVQAEIDALIAEKNSLQSKLEVMREERMRLLAPVDLSEAWSEVKSGKAEIIEWRERLAQHSVELLAKESDIALLKEEIRKKQDNLDRKDALVERTLSGVEDKFAEVSTLLDNTRKESERATLEHKLADNHLKVREHSVTQREETLAKQQEEVNAHEIDLANREEKLRVNQEVFIRAQNYIKNRHL